MYCLKDFRKYIYEVPHAIAQLLEIHKLYFDEGIYRDFVWSENNCNKYIMQQLMDSDFEMLVIEWCGCVVGFSCIAFTNRYQEELIAIGDAFYIDPKHRNGQCSQMLLDFSLQVCYSRGAKHFHQSSAAGFPDNGCNERAFRMLLKRNSFRAIGTSLIREL